jgi:hypothetical protein
MTTGVCPICSVNAGHSEDLEETSRETGRWVWLDCGLTEALGGYLCRSCDREARRMGSGMISNIVGRCHVGERYPRVLAYAVSCLRKGRKTWHAMPRESRRLFVREVIDCHRHNRLVYRAVMSGRLDLIPE